MRDIMDIRLPNLRSRVFLRLLRANILLCAVSVTVLCLVFLPFLFSSAAQNDYERNEAYMDSAEAYLDSMQSYAESAVSSLQNQEWVYSVYLNHIVLDNPLDYATTKAIKSDLLYFFGSRPDLLKFSLFFYGDTDTLFSNRSYISHRSYMENMFPDKLDYAIFPLSDSQEPGFSSVTHQGQQYLSYRTPFGNADSSVPKGEICILFSPVELQKHLQSVLGDTVSSISILSHKGEELYTLALREPSASDSVLSRMSENYTYQVTMSLYSSQGRVLRLTFWGILAALLTSLGLALFLTSVNYKPFGNIVRQYVGEIPLKADEFALLSQSVQQIQDTCDEQEQALAKLQPMVQTSAVQHLLNGSFLLSDEMDEELALCGIRFPYPVFNVVSVNLPELLDAAAVNAVLKPLITQLAHQADLVTYLRPVSSNGFHILVNCHNKQSIERLLDRLTIHFRNFGMENYHIGVGLPQQRPGQLYLACEQADTALNAAFLQRGKIMYFSALRSPCNREFYYPLSEEVLLSHAIAEGHVEKACEILQNIIERNCGDSDQQKNLSLLYFNLYTTIARSINGLDIQIPYYDEFPSFPSDGKQLYKQLEELVLSVSRQLAAKTKEYSGPSLEQQILDYVDANLFSPDLSLVEIADHFNKSTGYISVIFKRERGTNYNNYVNEKRIEEAVRLMATNTMDLQSICEAVGYTNMSRFTKNFQKYTGHNPV